MNAPAPEHRLVNGDRMARRVDIWHNILWSTYKGAVFSELHKNARKAQLDTKVFQIAETERARMSLSGVDLSRHTYPYTLMFKGAYESVSVVRRAFRLGA